MKKFAIAVLYLALVGGFASGQQQNHNPAHKTPSSAAISPHPATSVDLFAGKWEIPQDSTGRASCANFTLTRLTPDRYRVAYGWCSDEMENGTLQLVAGRLVGSVVDNMTKDVSRCEIAFLDDKATISVKTIWPRQQPRVDFLRKVGAPAQPKATAAANKFVGTWRVTACCNQYWPYRVTDLGGGRFQLDRGLFRGDGTENFDFSKPLILQLINGMLVFDGPQGDTGYRSKITIELNANDEMVFKEYVGGTVASPYQGPRIR